MTEQILPLAKLLENTGAVPIHAHRETVSGVATDSRCAGQEFLFLCVRGLHHDGHDYVSEAVQNGASVVLSERTDISLPDGCDLWTCPDTRAAEAVVYDNLYDHPASGMTEVGITGSNGKTSTAYLLRAILSDAGEKTGMLTTIGAFAGGERIECTNGGTSLSDAVSAMTTPDPAVLYATIAQMRDRGCTHLVYEASSHALDLHKTDAIHPEIAIFTGLDREHLDYHGTMDAYFAAKSRLFDLLSPHGARIGITNADDPYTDALTAAHPDVLFRTVTAQEDKIASCDVTGLQFRQNERGCGFLYYSDDAIFRLRLPIPGRHSMYNAMYAATAALCLGVHPIDICDSLSAVAGVPGRLERVPTGTPYTVYIDYAHTPRAMESTLRTLRSLHPTRLTAVFGCGGDRDPGKRPRMGHIASVLADRVILTGDNPRSEDPEKILSEIRAGIAEGASYTEIPDRAAAIDYTLQTAIPGEIIAFLGKGHEKYEWIGNEKRPFDETEKILEAADRYRTASDGEYNDIQ